MKKIKRALHCQHLKFYCDFSQYRYNPIEYCCSPRDLDLRILNPKFQLLVGPRLNSFLSDFAAGSLKDYVTFYDGIHFIPAFNSYRNRAFKRYKHLDDLVMDTYGETLILNLAGLQESTKNGK